MATNAYVGVSGAAKALKNIYIGVANSARKIKRAYIGVGNLSRLWWKSQFGYVKTIPFNGTVNIQNYTEWGTYCAENGSYLIAVDRSKAICVNKNDVCTSTSISGPLYEVIASSGNRVWYLNHAEDDYYFNYLGTNLVEGVGPGVGVTPDYNRNWGGGSRDYNEYGYAIFFEFSYPRDTLIKIMNNGTYSEYEIPKNTGNAYRQWMKLDNYIIHINDGAFASGNFAINTQNFVLTSISGGAEFACAHAENNGSSVVFICGAPAYSTCTVWSLNKSLVLNETGSPDREVNGACRFSCVAYGGLWYFYIDDADNNPFSINGDYVIMDCEDLRTKNANISFDFGHGKFNGSVYFFQRSTSYPMYNPNGFIKCS